MDNTSTARKILILKITLPPVPIFVSFGILIMLYILSENYTF